MADLHDRNIDGHAQFSKTVTGQFSLLEACRTHDPFADADNQARVFGNRDETIRRDQLSVIVTPAQQRFNAASLAVCQFDLWLIDEEQLLPFDGVTQGLQKTYAVANFHGHVARVKTVFTTMANLGTTQGDVRALDGVCTTAIDIGQMCDTDGGSEHHLLL